VSRGGLMLTRDRQAIATVNFWWNVVDSRFSAAKMCKDERKAREPKGGYRVRNRSEYNAGLIARGNVPMWIDDSVWTDASEPGTRKHGRPCIYVEAVTQMLLGVKQAFRLPLRAPQGFAQCLCELAFACLPVSNYSTLSRSAQTLGVVLPVVHVASGRRQHGAQALRRRRMEGAQRRLLETPHLVR
jgi:hypothetical protein